MDKAPRTLLVIDDSPEDRGIYWRHLSSSTTHTYRFIEATLGNHGIELYRQHQPDAVLLDNHLPDAEVTELLAMLQHSSGKTCPIIVLAEYEDKAAKTRVLNAGAQDYLVKQWLTPDILQFAVNAAIDGLHAPSQIEEQRSHASVLDERKQLLELAASHARAGLWTWDIGRDRITWSPECYDLYGLDPALGSPQYHDWCNALHPEDRERATAEVTRVISELLTNYTTEFRVIHPRRGIRWLTGRGELSLNERGEPIRLSGINFDITERKQAELALRESEDRLRLAIQSADVGIWDWDLTTNTLTWDERCKAMFGLPAGATVSIERFFDAVHPGDRAHLKQIVQASLTPSGSGSYDVEYRAIGIEDGIERWIKAKGQAYFDSRGVPQRFIGTVMDVTDRKRAEQAITRHTQELVELNEELSFATRTLDERNKDLDQFVYIASHDLKTPLRGIRNLASWLQDDIAHMIPPESQQHLKLLVDRVERMEALIKALLNYSRAGRISQTPEQVDVGELVREIISMISAPPGVHITLASFLPVIKAKRLTLSQVFTNLIDNAIKHGCLEQRGKVIISAVEQQDTWEFTVADAGPGIDSMYHEKIFGIFETLNASSEVSTGIGLAIVKRLIETEGGTIRIRSKSGAGTAFSFTWPKQA